MINWKYSKSFTGTYYLTDVIRAKKEKFENKSYTIINNGYLSYMFGSDDFEHYLKTLEKINDYGQENL